jgi:hypothetical protein
MTIALADMVCLHYQREAAEPARPCRFGRKDMGGGDASN